MEQELSHNYFVIRVVPGKEDSVMDYLTDIAKKKDECGVYSLFKPELIRGYIFAEASEMVNVIDILRDIPNTRGIIKKPLTFEDIKKYLDKKNESIVVNERDIVEIITGPFKGEQAKVIRLIPGKDEVVIEPINSTVLIPITLDIEDIRLIENKNEKEIK